jgi:class 3 adenylate cyclase
VTDSCIDSVAQAGQIIVWERLGEALRRSLRFDEGSEVELKGLSGKHRVFEVVWTE